MIVTEDVGLRSIKSSYCATFTVFSHNHMYLQSVSEPPSRECEKPTLCLCCLLLLAVCMSATECAFIQKNNKNNPVICDITKGTEPSPRLMTATSRTRCWFYPLIRSCYKLAEGPLQHGDKMLCSCWKQRAKCAVSGQLQILEDTGSCRGCYTRVQDGKWKC